MSGSWTPEQEIEMSGTDAGLPVDAHPGELPPCVSCGARRDGPFCGQCGQREMRGRHSVIGWVSGAFAQLLNLDRGLVSTMGRLTVEPGTVVRGYIGGRSISYTHPLTYLIMAFALAVIANQFFTVFEGGDDRAFVAAVIPFLALASRVLSWKGDMNYAEHLIMIVYLFAHAVILLILPMSLLSFAVGAEWALGAAFVVLVAACGYFVWAYSRVFVARPVLAALRGLAVIALGFGLWAGFLTLINNWIV